MSPMKNDIVKNGVMLISVNSLAGFIYPEHWNLD
jgi:hypothetical protein